MSKVRSALSSLGMNMNQFSGHSFHIGAATTALHTSVTDAKIKMFGRWESSAYQLYLCTPHEELGPICAILANSSCMVTAWLSF